MAKIVDIKTGRNIARGINEFCSFCGRSQKEVGSLVAGPTVMICPYCIKECNEILTEHGVRPIGPRPRRPRKK